MKVLEELKRRNVFRVAVAYTIVAWLIAQIADLVFNNIGAPDWVMPALFLMLALGFVAALVISWAYEVTPEGIKRERDVNRDVSITHVTAKKLDYITIAAVLAAAVMFVVQQNGGRIGDPHSAGENGVDGAIAVTDRPESAGRSIAVLPFANRSNNDEDLFFTDGIHDDLLTQLAKINGLKVISRTSVMQYRNTDKPLPEIARDLGVATVLEGGVQRAGHRIRINAQLIDVATDEHLWAETFDREMTIENLFDIQSEITRQIVAAVRGQLTTDEQDALTSTPTLNLEAYEAYLRARNILTGSGYNLEKYMDALPYAKLAVALDPDFALGYLLLAEIHGQVMWSGQDDSPERREAADDALDRATAILGSDAPDALAARGEFLYRFERDFPAALDAQLKAYAAMPGDSQLLQKLGYTYRRVGRWEESVQSFQKATVLDPASVSAAAGLAETLDFMLQADRLATFLEDKQSAFGSNAEFASVAARLPVWTVGDVEEARRRFQTVRPSQSTVYFTLATDLAWYERNYAAVIDAWNLPEIREIAGIDGLEGLRFMELARAHEFLGKSVEAGELLEEAISEVRNLDRSRSTPVVAYKLATLALVSALRGDKPQAIAAAEEAMRLIPVDKDAIDGPYFVKVMAEVMARTGERDRALDLIAQVLEKPAGFRRWELYLDPRWDFFRDDDRFNDLIRPLNLDQDR